MELCKLGSKSATIHHLCGNSFIVLSKRSNSSRACVTRGGTFVYIRSRLLKVKRPHETVLDREVSNQNKQKATKGIIKQKKSINNLLNPRLLLPVSIFCFFFCCSPVVFFSSIPDTSFI
jgi:hypothetical protein